MERLVTKCCHAFRYTEDDENGIPIRVMCEGCDNHNPEMEWVDVDLLPKTSESTE